MGRVGSGWVMKSCPMSPTDHLWVDWPSLFPIIRLFPWSHALPLWICPSEDPVHGSCITKTVELKFRVCMFNVLYKINVASYACVLVVVCTCFYFYCTQYNRPNNIFLFNMKHDKLQFQHQHKPSPTPAPRRNSSLIRICF